jgi:uncharacterized protein YndB with AHSA1/START domain
MPNIHHEVLIGAPAENVYKAITSQEGLSAWWTPGTSAKAEIGSVSRFPFGPNYHKEMKIRVSYLVNQTLSTKYLSSYGSDLSS